MCLDPVDIDDGTVTLTGNLVGDTATYTCDPGFELVGDVITTCTLEMETLHHFNRNHHLADVSILTINSLHWNGLHATFNCMSAGSILALFT